MARIIPANSTEEAVFGEERGPVHCSLRLIVADTPTDNIKTVAHTRHKPLYPVVGRDTVVLGD